MAKFEVYRDARSRWRWQFLDEYGRVIAKSPEGYWSTILCFNDITTMKRLAGDAEVSSEGTA